LIIALQASSFRISFFIDHLGNNNNNNNNNNKFLRLRKIGRDWVKKTKMNPTLGLFLLTVLSLPILLQIYFGYFFSYLLAYTLPSGVEDDAEFDFIVVGAGSAGAVVAGRLAEAGHEVLLVEAGGPANWIQTIPGFALAAQVS
jgi:hypothetical protein